MRPDGRADAVGVLRDLLLRPSQLSPLARIAIDALAARAEMLRVRQLLGPHFGLDDEPAELAPFEAGRLAASVPG